ncbi:hypothetical protein Pelo_18087 [Pelomyxa schiedti]|nr:hypothetical protein Pelo_18087 [Pelomyxa schiedti]
MKDTRFVTTASAVPDHCTSQPGAPTGGRPHQSPPEKGLATTKGPKFHLNHKVPNAIVEVHLWRTPRPCLTTIQTLTPPPPLFVTSGPPSALPEGPSSLRPSIEGGIPMLFEGRSHKKGKPIPLLLERGGIRIANTLSRRRAMSSIEGGSWRKANAPLTERGGKEDRKPLFDRRSCSSAEGGGRRSKLLLDRRRRGTLRTPAHGNHSKGTKDEDEEASTQEQTVTRTRDPRAWSKGRVGAGHSHAASRLSRIEEQVTAQETASSEDSVANMQLGARAVMAGNPTLEGEGGQHWE